MESEFEMMQVIQKWRVEVTFSHQVFVLWVSENHLANVLRKLADLEFSENSLEQPTQIQIALV